LQRRGERERRWFLGFSSSGRDLLIDFKSSGMLLGVAERWEVTTELLPLIQRLKTTELFGGSCLSVAYRSGIQARPWVGWLAGLAGLAAAR
jgi:hypothetical protein